MIVKMILTNGYDPDPRVYKEALSLVNLGHDIEILAWDREKKYHEYPFEIIDGIRIRRFYSHGKYGSGIKQLLGYFRYISEVINYLNDNNYDFMHCHDFDALLLGYLIKMKNKKLRLVYDEHDLFYLYFENRGKFHNLLFSKLIKVIEHILLKKVDYHIVVTPNMQELYKNKSNSTVITNAPLKRTFMNSVKTQRDNIVIGFIGMVRYFEELKTLIDISNKFETIEVLIAGNGPKLQDVKNYVTQNGYNNIRILGQYHQDQLMELYSQIDITYLIYPFEDSKVSLPNKFFESIVTDTPIIADENSEFGKLVKQDSLGWTINSQKLEENLTELISKLVNNKEQLLSQKVNIKNNKEKYYWESNIEKLKKIYES